jgi:hypothetical protein
MKFRITILFWFLTFGAFAQQGNTGNQNNNLSYQVINGDTVYSIDIEEVYVFPEHKFNSRREERKYNRLLYNIKLVYPYAKLAKTKLDSLNNGLLKLKTDKEKKAYTKAAERQIKDEFEPIARQLTISQGKVLVKLIDRETGQTCYTLVKDLRGTITAVFWQAVARLFGNNLKSDYDAEGDDKQMEEIIIAIEKGEM